MQKCRMFVVFFEKNTQHNQELLGEKDVRGGILSCKIMI